MQREGWFGRLGSSYCNRRAVWNICILKYHAVTADASSKKQTTAVPADWKENEEKTKRNLMNIKGH